MGIEAEVAGAPAWTSREVKRGIDPLGMQTTSVDLYQKLVPGISNVTLRVRYYGFYAWLTDSFARQIREKSLEAWCIYLRRAEALYALIASQAGNEHGVAGVVWANKKLAAARNNKISFHANTDRKVAPQYLKQKFGAFGAAYGSQLWEIGILVNCEDHPVLVPSDPVGDDLAKAFRRAIGALAPQFLSIAKKGTVTKQELKRMAPMLPSRIQKSSAERQLYEDLLFARKSQSTTDVSRSQTLQLALHVARSCGHDIDPSDVRWSLYSKNMGNGRPLPSPDRDLEGQRFLWATYQANDLLHLAYEGLLEYVLGLLSSVPTGMQVTDLITRASDRLARQLESTGGQTWSDLVRKLELPANAWSDEHELSEFWLANDLLTRTEFAKVQPDDFGACALLLVAVLQKRWSDAIDKVSAEAPPLTKASSVRSLVTELAYLTSMGSESLRDFIAQLLKRRVIERHLWVAVRKLRAQGDYTFLMDVDEGKVRQSGKDGPVFTNPRLGPALTFLRDIHLLGSKGPTVAALALLGADQ